MIDVYAYIYRAITVATNEQSEPYMYMYIACGNIIEIICIHCIRKIICYVTAVCSLTVVVSLSLGV